MLPLSWIQEGQQRGGLDRTRGEEYSPFYGAGIIFDRSIL